MQNLQVNPQTKDVPFFKENENSVSHSSLPDNPYLLLTPGPLSTTKSVKAAMLRDWCTWDDDYKSLVQSLRRELLSLASLDSEHWTTVLMQGSGTFAVESVIGSVIPPDGKLLIITNGAYGDRIVRMAECLSIPALVSRTGETVPPNLDDIENKLAKDDSITHIATVHVETTTGIQNPLKSIADLAKKYKKSFIVDAMSSFGGIPIDLENCNIDFLVSSANKCIQGVPGFGFIIARKETIKKNSG